MQSGSAHSVFLPGSVQAEVIDYDEFHIVVLSTTTYLESQVGSKCEQTQRCGDTAGASTPALRFTSARYCYGLRPAAWGRGDLALLQSLATQGKMVCHASASP